MKTLYVLTFGPFQQRKVNLSYEAAKIFHGMELNNINIFVIQVPVIWGMAKEAVAKTIQKRDCIFVLGLGEGHPDIFCFEVKPKNTLSSQLDIKGNQSLTDYVHKNSKPYYLIKNYSQHHSHMKKRGWPIKISQDAGSYLCEEMAYSIARQKKCKGYFVHVPSCHSKFSRSPLLSPTDISPFLLTLLIKITTDLNS